MLSRTSACLVAASSKPAKQQRKVVSSSGTTTFKRHLLPKAAYDLRRLRAKATLKVPPTDDRVIEYPRERLGLDYALNIALNKNHKLTPTNDAFRNLHTRHLLMHARGSVDKARSIEYSATGVENHHVFWVPPQLNPNMQPPSGQQQLSDAQFRKLGRMMADQIGESQSIFVQDSAVGSHRLAEVKTRTITNDANVSLLTKHMLVPTVATRVDPVLWPLEITVMIAPELKLSPQELADFGLKSNTFTVCNPERGLALIGGTNASAHIRAAIESLAASRTSNWSVPSVTLPSAHVVAAGANAGLVFDPSGILSHPKNADLVSGFGGAIWNDYGTFRMWGSVSHADTAAPRTIGDLVEKHGKSAVVTQSVKNQPIQYSHPAAVVFLVRDSTGVLPGVGRVASNVAGRLLASGYNGTSNVALFAKNGVAEPQGTTAKLFAGLVEANQTPVFVVNTRRRDGSELTAEEVRAVVNAALDGTLAKSKGVADMTLKMAVISQVPGVKSSLDASKGFKDKAEYAAAAKKLADSLGITDA